MEDALSMIDRMEELWSDANSMGMTLVRNDDPRFIGGAAYCDLDYGMMLSLLEKARELVGNTLTGRSSVVDSMCNEWRQSCDSFLERL
jgi:nitrous oxidase accessory protein NosD